MRKIMFLFSLVFAFSLFATACNQSETMEQTRIPASDTSKMKIKIGNKTFMATLINNDATKAFKKIMPLTIEVYDYGGFEKVGTLDVKLPTNDQRENNLGLGDIMLYQGNTLVFFYENHGGYNYTRIAKFDTTGSLRTALINSKAVTFELE